MASSASPLLDVYADAPQTPQEVFADAAAEAFGEATPAAREGEGVLSFRDFIGRVNPGLLEYEHVPRLVSVLQKTVDTFAEDGGLSFPEKWVWRPGEPNYKRVMILEPPRYFKSETASRLLQAYFVTRFPSMTGGIVSYGASLAWELSDDARGYYQQTGGVLSESTSAKRRWKTGEGGGVWAEGVGGSMLGKGFHLCSVDDPQDPEQAHSPTYQARFKSFWPQKFYSRREPGAGIVFVMQRLALDDAAGWLWKREEENPENWHVAVCDALKSSEAFAHFSGPRGLPAGCTYEPDDRKDGAPLAPSRFSLFEIDRTKTGSDAYTWDAQQMQRPGAVTGDFWREAWFQVHDTLPAGAYNGGKDWDTAYGEDEKNAASAYVETYRGPDLKDGQGQVMKDQQGNPLFTVYVEDCGWEWFEYPDLLYWMGGPKPTTENAAAIAPLPGPHYVEQRATGKSIAQGLRTNGVPCEEVPVTGGDKFTRSQHVQPRVSRGLVSVNRRVLDKLLRGDRQGLLRVKAEALQASKGGHLDLNDAFVQAINRHVRPKNDDEWGMW